MGKYDALRDYLGIMFGKVTLEPDELDEFVDGLPAVARRDPKWWSNDPGPGSPQARAWIEAGHPVASVDLEQGVVSFGARQLVWS